MMASSVAPISVKLLLYNLQPAITFVSWDPRVIIIIFSITIHKAFFSLGYFSGLLLPDFKAGFL